MRITVAWHDTERSEAALRAAERLLTGEGDELVLVRAVTMAGNEGSGQEATSRRDAARAALEARASAIEGPAVVRVELLQGLGGPAEQLLRFIEHSPPDILAVGVRRRSAVGKALLGSVAQALLLNANCPVLAVKARNAR